MDAGQVSRAWAGRAEPILPTTSVERTLDFWGAFGFDSEIWEDGGYAWVFPGPDGIRIDYSLSDDLDPFASSGMAYLTVPDIDVVYEAIVASGSVPQAVGDDGLPVRTTQQLRSAWKAGESLARVTRPLDQVWNKRELALFDPDNNLIRIGSLLR